MDFFLKWSINAEILDNSAYKNLFDILFEINETKNWHKTTKDTLLTMIRVRQIDGNVTIFDFLLKRLRSYIDEIGTYDDEKLKHDSKKRDNAAVKINVIKYTRINYLVC